MLNCSFSVSVTHLPLVHYVSPEGCEEKDGEEEGQTHTSFSYCAPQT